MVSSDKSDSMGDEESEETCGDTRATVPSHTYLAVRKRDDKVVGVIDLRHHINHPIVCEFDKEEIQNACIWHNYRL